MKKRCVNVKRAKFVFSTYDLQTSSDSRILRDISHLSLTIHNTKARRRYGKIDDQEDALVPLLVILVTRKHGARGMLIGSGVASRVLLFISAEYKPVRRYIGTYFGFIPFPETPFPSFPYYYHSRYGRENIEGIAARASLSVPFVRRPEAHCAPPRRDTGKIRSLARRIDLPRSTFVVGNCSAFGAK